MKILTCVNNKHKLCISCCIKCSSCNNYFANKSCCILSNVTPKAEKHNYGHKLECRDCKTYFCHDCVKINWYEQFMQCINCYNK